MKEEHPVIDWDDMTDADKAKAMDLLGQLNRLFDQYTSKGNPDEGKKIPSSQD